MSLTKKEKELLDELAEKGQVIVDSKEELEKLAKKLEKIFGTSDIKVRT